MMNRGGILNPPITYVVNGRFKLAALRWFTTRRRATVTRVVVISRKKVFHMYQVHESKPKFKPSEFLPGFRLRELLLGLYIRRILIWFYILSITFGFCNLLFSSGFTLIQKFQKKLFSKIQETLILER